MNQPLLYDDGVTAEEAMEFVAKYLPNPRLKRQIVRYCVYGTFRYAQHWVAYFEGALMVGFVRKSGTGKLEWQGMMVAEDADPDHFTLTDRMPTWQEAKAGAGQVARG